MTKKELVKGLTLTTTIMIVAGSMIGSGIFRKPATMASQLMSPELLLLIWLTAGLITFVGALCNSEVAGMIDETGGQYVYFKKMYGNFISFIYGWSVLAVILTGSQAAIAYVFGEYLGYFINYPDAPDSLKNFSFYIPVIGNIFPFHEFGPKMAAILCIILLTGINYIGVVFGGAVQSFVTSIKIASIVFLSVFLFVSGSGNFSNLTTDFNIPDATQANLISLIGLALAGAFWAYDGWINVTYVSGEVKNAKRNVPLGLLFGTLIVVVTYLLINAAYLYILPVEKMAESPLVAATAAEVVFGNSGAVIISIAVIVSTFGALNGSILGTARVSFAMSRNNMFIQKFGEIHPRFGTPHLSLLLQGFWSCVLVMSGTFDTITDYVIFAAWLFYLLGAFGVIVLRRKMPDAERPYKVWGYPFTPILFVVFSLLFLINSVISDLPNAAMGTLLILLGLPIYFYKRWQNKNSKSN